MEKIALQHSSFLGSFYFKQGKGPVVILIHGFAEDHTIWQHQVESLSKNYCCILPDLPGTGVSTLTSSAISIEDMADFIHAIAVQEQVVKPILLGHSMGGYITMAYADLYPDALAGLGLIHSSAYADDELKKENRLKSIRLIEREGKEVFLKAMIPNLYAEASKVKFADAMLQHLNIALSISSASLVAYYHAMINRIDRTTVLRAASYPVLFVIGKQDNAIPYGDMLAQSVMPNQGMVELLPEIGHTGMVEASEMVNSILNRYVESIYEGKIS